MITKEQEKLFENIISQVSEVKKELENGFKIGCLEHLELVKAAIELVDFMKIK